MKKTLFILICFAFTKAYSQYAIDHINAPLNPYLNNLTAKSYGLKGDVFSFNYEIFDKNGDLTLETKVLDLVPAYYTDKEEAKKNKGTYHKLDTKGRVISSIFYDKNGQPSLTETYSYTNDLLSSVKSKHVEAIYTYDTFNRIIKTISLNKLNNITTEHTYSYKKLENDVLAVNFTTIHDSDSSKIESVRHYKNGITVYDSTQKNLRVYAYDEKGNWISNQYPEVTDNLHTGLYKRSIIYYSDFNNPKFGFKYEKAAYSNTGLFYLTVNDKILRTVQKEYYGNKPNKFMLHFVPIVNYYIVPSMTISESLDNTDENATDNPTTVIKSDIVYYRDIDNGNFVVIKNGKRIKDYSIFNDMKFNEKGDLILYVNNKPNIILSDFKSTKSFEIKKGQSFRDYEEDIITNSIIDIAKQVQQQKCESGNCVDGFGIMQKTKNKYTGFWSNSTNNGPTTVNFSNNDIYRGEIVNGIKQGVGVYQFTKSGNYLIGEWKNDKLNGLGFYMNGDKIIQYGIYEDYKLKVDMSKDPKANQIDKNCRGNCENGFGIKTFDNGTIYIGFFINSKRSKIGYYKYSDGSIYRGAIKDNHLSGYGWLTWKNGHEYSGYWKSSVHNGLGVYTYKSSEIKAGEWLNNKLQKKHETTQVKNNANPINTKADKFIELFNPNNTKQSIDYLKNLAVEMVNTGKSKEDITTMYYNVFNTVYDKNKKLSFEYMMIMPNDYVNNTLKKLNPERRTYIRETSKQYLQKKSGKN